MKAYKCFGKDLKCLGFQFEEGKVNVTEEANCVKNGFHCAENPLDCLSYYRWNNSVCYIVEAAGDLDEDGTDSKISCTELTLVKKLSLEEFISESLEYMKRYPSRNWNHNVAKDKSNGPFGFDKFIIVRGKHPIAKGPKGIVIGLAREAKDGPQIIETRVFISEDDNNWNVLQELGREGT